jgi:glucose/arabinose dehydrogenase
LRLVPPAISTTPTAILREKNRANILEYTPEGQFVKIYASGIRNPVGIAVNPLTGELWCSVNERDALGDNLVPDISLIWRRAVSTAGLIIIPVETRIPVSQASTPK